MSKAAEFVLTWLGYFAGALFLVFLIAATAYGLLRAYDRRKEEKVQKRKRLSVKLGQQLEVEYSLAPETKEFAADVEVDRVLAYNGAVCVDIAPMLRANVPSFVENLAERCRKAEGLAPAIPF
ncbi:MAG TPA: hypothetical protein VJ553_02385 [Candidatus Paceibacterota bacterium]|nr:hypothetical protein [Candidatus Paceibacterota bacterium]